MSKNAPDLLDERTTPLGLYHYARSYRAAFTLLRSKRLDKLATHPFAPRDFVLIHAIELYLKAFLRLQGYELKVLKYELGHDFSRLGGEFKRHGGTLDDEDLAVLELLSPENVFGTRYIVTGPFTRATSGALKRTADSLHDTVYKALRRAKIICRK